MNALTDDPLGSLKKLITELANTSYSRDGKGLLLSQVGDIVSKKYPEFRNVLGSRKLVGFIEAELAGVVQILTSPENHIVKVILPEHVEVNDNVMSFFPQRGATSTSVRYPRYNRAFWAAFSHPLAKGFTRLVELEPVVRYEDIEGEAAVSSLKKVVPPDLIIDQAIEPDPAKRTQRINEIIINWLQANNVSQNIVEVKVETELASARIPGSNKGSLLEVLLAALDDADLKRIQMPLDVVAKLQRRY